MSATGRNVGLIRALSILRQLEAGQRVTLDRLAREYHVSERTIRRDLLALEAAGAPMQHEPDAGYGLRGHWWLAFPNRRRYQPSAAAALDPVDGIDTS